MRIPICSLCCLFLVSCGNEKLPPDARNSLGQTINYIEQYKSLHSSIPSRDDFWLWYKTNNPTTISDYEVGGDSLTNEYFISIWLGERMVIYSSKDKSVKATQ